MIKKEKSNSEKLINNLAKLLKNTDNLPEGEIKKSIIKIKKIDESKKKSN